MNSNEDACGIDFAFLIGLKRMANASQSFVSNMGSELRKHFFHKMRSSFEVVCRGSATCEKFLTDPKSGALFPSRLEWWNFFVGTVKAKTKETKSCTD